MSMGLSLAHKEAILPCALLSVQSEEQPHGDQPATAFERGDVTSLIMRHICGVSREACALYTYAAGMLW